MQKAETPAQRIARELAQKKRKPKLGLALSGGGFRAALFHIGVLARLADAGLLRHVQVISTVSGGSIVGALYYLHVLRLLESKPDNEINDVHYREIVDDIALKFPCAVERNVRGRAFLNPFKNVAMAVRRGYSRTYRIAELYEKWFYREIYEPDDSEASSRLRRIMERVMSLLMPTLTIPMTDLEIEPEGWPPHKPFDPDVHNEGRNAPVPILLINAATLNTGHNWRFEALYMGEPALDDPGARETDKNIRFARTRYDLLPESLQSFKLAAAVAASAAFPGLCRPVDIRDLFEDAQGDRVTVKLMDGGAHDNQGVEGLLDRGSTHLIVSDGAGQLKDEEDPAHAIPLVIERARSMMFDHARELQLTEVISTLDTAFMHLLKGVDAPVVQPIGVGAGAVGVAPAGLSTASFGTAEETQRLLSRVRTDLDAFSEVEARSLMLNGYRMTEAELAETPAITAMGMPLDPSPPWWFASMAPWLANPLPHYRRQLSAARSQLFKPFKQSPALAFAAKLGAVLVAALGLAAVVYALLYSDYEVSLVWTAVAVVAAVLLIIFYVRPLPIVSSLLFDHVFPALAALVLPFAALALLIEGRIFRRLGAEDRLGPPPAAPG
jgi:NTE family protein